MSAAPQAQLSPTPLGCRSCGHEWMEPILSMVTVRVWVLHVRSLRCPACGAGWHRLAFRTKVGAGQ